ncbi:MAG: EAL domain-containing protein [Lachnospiraceae bacterium]|nr:EAL domain-containing protein [Lachnospiraceae bacterium]
MPKSKEWIDRLVFQESGSEARSVRERSMITKENRSSGLVYTNDNCIGCNKCIRACSCMGACISTLPDENGRSSIEVDGSRCVACGACFDACEHNARDYRDDTLKFFSDLKKGEQISLLIAPAFMANYPEQYSRILGGLKKLGVNRMINVSFGADITTWGYINYIKENDFLGGISQPCPAVVGYIERYLPELLPKLFPVQSPLMCAAIYARNELGITDKLAFISPCIAKKLEIDDPNNHGYVSYNVTFDHLMEYVGDNDVYGEPCMDEIEYGLGSVYPMPGGLKENVYWLLGNDVFVRQMEGEKRMYEYLKANRERLRDGKTPYLFVDVLNCENGCIYGTGTDPEVSGTDDTYYHLHDIQESVKKTGTKSAWSRELSPAERLANLNRQFAKLKLEDYTRKYTDRSESCKYKEPSAEELEEIFIEMKKLDEGSRKINCSCCGYNTCRDMAVAIFNGFNHKDNCIHYLKDLVEEKAALTEVMTGLPNAEGMNVFMAQKKAEETLTRFNAFYFNLRNVGLLNRRFGKKETDQLLVRYSRKVADFAKQEECVGRLSGDNFMALILKERSEEFLKLLEGVEVEARHGGKEIPVIIQAVTGCLDIDESHQDSASIVGMCTTALNEAKNTKKVPYLFATPEMSDMVFRQKQIVDEFPRALAGGEFKAYYQPKVDTTTNEIVGAEALVRWIHEGRLIPPDEFVPILEMDGSICKLDFHIFESVCRDIRKWSAEGIKPVRISTNFSRKNLSDPSFSSRIEETLEKYEVPREYIEVEITETTSEEENGLLSKFITDMHNADIMMAIDDFGTGYSSLNLLRDFPADVLKIDKSFIDQHTNTERDNVVLANIAKMAKELNMKVITEGVERWDQVEFLKGINVNLVQGFLFDKPMPEDTFEERLRARIYPQDSGA